MLRVLLLKFLSGRNFSCQNNTILGLKGPTVAAEGCRPPQELEKTARRAAIFLVFLKVSR